MASTVMHMCVAKKINKILNIKDENMLLLGAIAPDISKHIGEDKNISHFLTEDREVDIDKFLNKYKSKLDNTFILGYFIHLYTDLLWDKYFISDIVNKDTIKLLNGNLIPKDKELYKKLIYNDYTNLNIVLLDEYNLDLSLFYNEAVVPNITMDEIPVDKLYKLLDYSGVLIANTKINKDYTFNIENAKTFIDTSSHLILLKIKELLNIEK